MVDKKVIIKSVIVAVIATLTDFYVHQNYANKEVLTYYIFKITFYFLMAWLVFGRKEIIEYINIFKLKDRSIPFFLWFSIFISFYHGLYYRVLDWFAGQGFLSFARVGDVRLFHFSDNIFIEGVLDWAIVHSMGIFLGFLIAELLDKQGFL